ncbi:hypothetical protein PMAYCL1PPCAC_02602, partial [Pristionchus mayeri]
KTPKVITELSPVLYFAPSRILRRMKLLILLLLLSPTLADELLFLQTLWRHGDRTPTSTYPSDPYQEDFWGVPWGELTTRGQKQHFLQGQRLRRVYVDGYGLVSGKYNRNETVVRSSDYPRCIQSALSNLAGFYAGSPTHPTDVDNWPSDWTPIPIHTVPQSEDRILECPISNAKVPCPVAQKLFDKRIQQKNFLDFIASQWMLIADILMHGGDSKESEFETIAHIYQAISVEKGYFNLTLPDWITDDVYNGIEDAVEQGQDYVVGGAGFDYPEDEEMVRLRGGFLLKEWTDNLNAVINGTNTLKYQAYSGHDYSIVALLMVLEAKTQLLGLKNPEYSATVACELWRRDEGYAVKFLFSRDEYSEYEPITKLISGCPSNSDFCALDKFVEGTKKYIPYGVE